MDEIDIFKLNHPPEKKFIEKNSDQDASTRSKISIQEVLRKPYVYIVLYLCLAIQIGISHQFRSILTLFLLLVLFGIEALILRLTISKEKFPEIYRKVLFVQFPLFLLILRNNFWLILPDRILLLIVLVCVIGFLAWSLRRKISETTLINLAVWSFPAFVVLALTTHIFLIHFINEWRLLAEEGQVMAWVTRISHGQVTYRDVIVTRGPFIIYTLAGVLKIFGETLVIKRATLLVISVGMSYAYFYSFKSIFTSRFLVFVVFLTMILIHNPSYRIGFGVLALAIFLTSLARTGKWRPLAAGVCSALACLSSVEVGLCSIVAIAATAIAGMIVHRQERRRYLEVAFLALAGFLLIILPPALYFTFRGELKDVISGIILYPKYAMLGFASAPYPNLLKIIQYDIQGQELLFPTTRKIFILWYLPILIYLFSFFIFIRNFARRSVEPKMLIIFGVTIFGWLAFRSALGRTDFHHLYFCVGPAFAVAALHADRLKEKIPWKSAVAAFVTASLLPAFFLLQRPSDRLLPSMKTFVANLQGTTKIPADFEPFKVDRLQGILSPPALRNRVESVVRILRRYLKPGDGLYVFPNLPMYYFLLDSPNPTRFEWAYQAASSKMREEVVRSLEQAKPKFVIYSVDPRQRLDRIPAEIAIPEIVNYLDEHYIKWRSVGSEEIRIRKPEK